MEFRQATDQDWAILQGGRPTVTSEGNLTIITHDYGDGMQITRHKMIDPDDTVRFNIGGDIVEFPSALVKSLEGDPCEQMSRSVGGDPYPRIKNND